MDPLWLKIVHVLSAALVLGGSIGIGFFMWNADRSRDAAIVAATGRIVMFAEALITAPAVAGVVATGVLIAGAYGLPLWHGWLGLAMALLAVSGLCWAAGLWLHHRAWRIAADAAEAGTPLPPRYDGLMRAWYRLGWPSSLAILGVFGLMVLKPAL
jgi:uncharacterized membrane protein